MKNFQFPRYIQRISVKDSPEKPKNLDSLFRFQYMGSAEFEFGALPHTVKKLRKFKKHLQIKSMPLEDFGESLYFVGRSQEYELACKVIEDALQADPSGFPYQYPFKEQVFLEEALRGWNSFNTEGWLTIQQKRTPPEWVPFAWFLDEENAQKWLDTL